MTNSSIFYVFYGLMQGITEFIPISSSGHLNILEILFKNLESRNYLYETSAHFASLLALLLYLFANRHFSKSNIKAYWKILIYATIPAVILGFILKFYDVNTFFLGLVQFFIIQSRKVVTKIKPTLGTIPLLATEANSQFSL